MAKGFKGGVHPAEHKELTRNSVPQVLAAPELVFVPVSQHIGTPAIPSVEKGDEVLKGQVIAQAGGFVSVPIHSPVSGKVKKLDTVSHILGTKQQAIVIVNDGEDNWVDHKKNPDWENLEPDQIKNLIQQAGVVGLGGATFPTHVKLSPPKDKVINIIILNGAECEPYLTADHQVMLQKPQDVVAGLRLFMKVLGLKNGIIAIENNKPDAIEAISKAANRFDGIEVVSMNVKYPQGAEKQLIYAMTGREVPSAKLPMDVGCVVQNVATASATYRAVAFGEPLIGRYCTVTGDAIANPQNLEIVIGTPLSYILEHCGGLTNDAAEVIAGGPMMGIAQASMDAPAIKGTGGLLCLSPKEAKAIPERACIRCGTCVSNCPMGLAPTTIASYVKHKMISEADKAHTLDCIECGCCSFGCPSRIPLVQYIRLGKGEILAARKKGTI